MINYEEINVILDQFLKVTKIEYPERLYSLENKIQGQLLRGEGDTQQLLDIIVKL